MTALVKLLEEFECKKTFQLFECWSTFLVLLSLLLKYMYVNEKVLRNTVTTPCFPPFLERKIMSMTLYCLSVRKLSLESYILFQEKQCVLRGKFVPVRADSNGKGRKN